MTIQYGVLINDSKAPIRAHMDDACHEKYEDAVHEALWLGYEHQANVLCIFSVDLDTGEIKQLVKTAALRQWINGITETDWNNYLIGRELYVFEPLNVEVATLSEEFLREAAE